MTEWLIKKMNVKVTLLPGDADLIGKSFTMKKIKRKQFLSQEEELCDRAAFVGKGALFAYSTDGKGVEHVLQFASCSL